MDGSDLRTRAETLMEQFPAHEETIRRVERTSMIRQSRFVASMQTRVKLSSIVTVLEGMAHKYSFEPDHITLGEKNPSLTIQDMGGKAQIVEKLQSHLLPSIKHLLASLLSSLGLTDPNDKRTMHVVDIDSTLEILSNLDQTLESTVSSTVSLTLESPIPDEAHDYGLENLKMFRCSYLGKGIKSLIGRLLYDHLFQFLTRFIGWCAITFIVPEDSRLTEEGCDLRRRIHMFAAVAQGVIDKTINWCQKSDWEMVHEAWLLASRSADQALAHFTSRTNRTIQSIPEADPVDDMNLNERLVARGLLDQVAKSALPLLKLARILIKKVSVRISKKVTCALGAELNSQTMKQLHKAPQSIVGSLDYLADLSFLLNLGTGILHNDNQHVIRSAIRDLPKDIEPILTVLDSLLIPLLPGIEGDSPEHQLKFFFPTLKQSWDTASDRMMDVMKLIEQSFELEE